MIAGIDTDAAIRAGLLPDERVLWHSCPGAGRLFLSVVPRLVRDLIFLSVIAFGIYAGGWREADTTARVIIALVVVILIWSLASALREGTSARSTHYLVTDRRILLLAPRGWSFVILPWMPKDVAERHRLAWLDGAPEHGPVHDGRGTLRIRYQAWMQRSRNYPDMVYRSRMIRLYAVIDPDKAVEMIAQIRRNHRNIPGDTDDQDPDADA